MGTLAGAALARLSSDAEKEIQTLAGRGLIWEVTPAFMPQKDRILSNICSKLITMIT